MLSGHRLARLSLAAFAMVATIATTARAQKPTSSAVDGSTCPGVYAGGWALRVDSASCPPDAPVWCGNGAQPRCCPSGLSCQGSGDYIGNYCCAGIDCVALSYDYPQCPDTDWTLFGVNGTIDNGGWCCKPGKNGTYWTTANSLSVGCISRERDTVLADSQSWAEPVPVSAPTPCSISSTSTTRYTSATPADTAAGADSAADPASGSSSGHRLGSGSLAGIVIGSFAAVALFGIGIWLLLAHLGRKRSPGTAHELPGGAYNSFGPNGAGGPAGAHGIADGIADGMKVAGAPHPQPTSSPGNISSGMTELAHSPVIAEADSVQKNQPFEMDGTHGW